MNFPTSPTLNQTYSLGSKTWKWNGVAWDLQSTGLTSSMVVTALGFTPYNATNPSGYITSSALSPYLTSAAAASTYQTQAGMSSYLTTATASSTYLPLAGGTLTGNLAFSGTGLRINGDFSNTTMSSRTLFQSSTTNGNTQVGAVPNGTAVNLAWFTYNSSDPTNASTGILRINSSEVALISGITGTGTYLPMVFLTSNTERGRVTTTGNWLLGTSTDNATDKLQVNGTIKSLSGGFTFPDGSTQTSAGASTGKAIAMAIVFGG